MKRVVFILIALLFAAGTTDVQAQWLKKLGQKAIDRAEDRAKKKVEKKVDDAVDKTVDDAFEGAEDAVKGEKKKETKAKSQQSAGTDDAEGVAAEEKEIESPEIAYSKSDFVSGDEIIFEDDQANEQIGEFPSQWELHRGNSEIASLNGKKVISMDGKDSWLEPLMKTPKNYLGDIFTLEFDYFKKAIEASSDGSFELDFMGPKDGRDYDVFTLTWYHHGREETNFSYGWRKSDGSRGNGVTLVSLAVGQWNHIAVSFNKRALKIYINGSRIANVPNVGTPPGWVTFWSGYGSTGNDKYITNVRIAKGAVPLYDRMMTDGKFITYGITFDVGKSTIKPESMGEINRIVKLMTDNPDLKFSVEGHTDSTGNAASNQTLSEARSKAIVDKLVELGISADRLASAGKGQDSPIADNSTDEGRAKNRRVEFVKQ